MNARMLESMGFDADVPADIALHAYQVGYDPNTKVLYAKGSIFQTEAEMYVMGILSDAQEELARGNSETARHYMNRAKYMLSEMMNKRREIKAGA